MRRVTEQTCSNARVLQHWIVSVSLHCCVSAVALLLVRSTQFERYLHNDSLSNCAIAQLLKQPTQVTLPEFRGKFALISIRRMQCEFEWPCDGK